MPGNDEQIARREVPRTVVDIEELLDPLRPLVAEFRYLHFLHFESKVSLEEVLSMRQDDLEVPYHKLFLQFCLGAASGQAGVTFFKEVDKGSAREDICLRAGNTSQPSELEATFHCAVPGDPTGGIDSNKLAFSKMLKCNTKDPQPWHFGIFGERIERLWFALFTYGDDGQVQSLKVTPEFPVSKIWDRRNLLFDMAQLDKVEIKATLQDAVPPRPEPGFKLLVRFVDTLCSKLGIPLDAIQLLRDDVELSLTGASIIAAGGKSIVLRRGHEAAVFKVSESSRISREQEIHTLVDGLPFVRPMLDPSYCGIVIGAGEGLSWMALAGYGRAMHRGDLQNDSSYERLWENGETALHGMHGKGAFHRDVKPGNFLMFGEQLQLNDFDASCFVDEPLEILRQQVGTPCFESPFFDKEKGFQYRDDWCSLVLSFLYVSDCYKGGGRNLALQRALKLNIPNDMRDCINWIFSAEAASGKPRVMKSCKVKTHQHKAASCMTPGAAEQVPPH